jgi:hypothetical protein
VTASYLCVNKKKGRGANESVPQPCMVSRILLYKHLAPTELTLQSALLILFRIALY